LKLPWLGEARLKVSSWKLQQEQQSKGCIGWVPTYLFLTQISVTITIPTPTTMISFETTTFRAVSTMPLWPVTTTEPPHSPWVWIGALRRGNGRVGTPFGRVILPPVGVSASRFLRGLPFPNRHLLIPSLLVSILFL